VQHATAAAQRRGRRLAERLSVRRSKPAQLVEPVVGGDIGHGDGCTAGVGQHLTNAAKPLVADATFGAHPADAVKGVAKSAFAAPDDATQAGDTHGCVQVRTQVSFGSGDNVFSRRMDKTVHTTARQALVHGAYTTSHQGPAKLRHSAG
jgi:hypothetical protein